MSVSSNIIYIYNIYIYTYIYIYDTVVYMCHDVPEETMKVADTLLKCKGVPCISAP